MGEPKTGRQARTAAFKQARLARAYTEGWDAGNDFARKQVADLLDRSGREREKLEERNKQQSLACQIAMDIVACLEPHCGVPDFMLQAFRDALAGKLPALNKKEDYKKARGAMPWKPGMPTPEEAISREET